MMKWVIFILIIISPSLIASSCHKHSSCVTSGGGVGGTGTLSVTPTHSGIYIDSCMVYIKYGTLDAPTNGVYDDSQACHLPAGDTVPVAVFTNLKAGIYYLYGVGYHATYSPPGVKGAIPYTLCSEQAASLYLPTYSYP